jgi:hypothetical protein
VVAPDLRKFAAPKSASDLQSILSSVIVELREKQLDPRTANAIGVISSGFLAALKTSSLELRITRLEQRARSLGGQHHGR